MFSFVGWVNVDSSKPVDQSIYGNIIKYLNYDKSTAEIMELLKQLKTDYFLLEKCEKGFLKGESYFFKKKNYNLSQLPVIYENDSFAVFRLKKLTLQNNFINLSSAVGLGLIGIDFGLNHFQ